MRGCYSPAGWQQLKKSYAARSCEGAGHRTACGSGLLGTDVLERLSARSLAPAPAHALSQGVHSPFPGVKKQERLTHDEQTEKRAVWSVMLLPLHSVGGTRGTGVTTEGVWTSDHMPYP